MVRRRAPDYVYNREQLPEILTVLQVALFLNCSESKVRNILSEKKMPFIRDGKIIRIQRQDLFEYIDNHLRSA